MLVVSVLVLGVVVLVQRRISIGLIWDGGDFFSLLIYVLKWSVEIMNLYFEWYSSRLVWMLVFVAVFTK